MAATTAEPAAEDNGGGLPLFPDNPSGNSGGNSHSGVSPSTERTVINAVKPGLVDISSNLQYQGSQAAATGMVISSDGLVLTNNHVITDTTQLYAVVVATGQRFSARWLGYDSTDDVAVIKLVSAHGLKTVPLGDSSKVKVGDGVVAMGNADGAGGVTPAPGRITGLNRTITASDSGEATSETLHGMFQTDAGIVQGDSGGALASADGHVIGMNTAAATGNVGQRSGRLRDPDQQGLVDRRQDHPRPGEQEDPDRLDRLHGRAGSGGRCQQGHRPEDPAGPPARAGPERLELPGAAGDAVVPGQRLDRRSARQGSPGQLGSTIIGELCSTPADMANIIAGDVITAVGKDKVSSPAELTQIMTGFKPGDSVQVTWVDIHGGDPPQDNDPNRGSPALS